MGVLLSAVLLLLLWLFVAEPLLTTALQTKCLQRPPPAAPTLVLKLFVLMMIVYGRLLLSFLSRPSSPLVITVSQASQLISVSALHASKFGPPSALSVPELPFRTSLPGPPYRPACLSKISTELLSLPGPPKRTSLPPPPPKMSPPSTRSLPSPPS